MTSIAAAVAIAVEKPAIGIAAEQQVEHGRDRNRDHDLNERTGQPHFAGQTGQIAQHRFFHARFYHAGAGHNRAILQHGKQMVTGFDQPSGSREHAP